MTPRSLSLGDWDLWHAWMGAHRVIAAEVDRALQAQAGVSKAEFSVLRTLGITSEPSLRVVDLGTALGWEKSRVSHLLTRMEHRGLVERAEDGAPGRRTAVALSDHGRSILKEALRVHENSVTRMFIERLTPEQAEVLRSWSQQIVSASTASSEPVAD